MEEDKYKLSFSVRVDTVTPGHVYFSVFSNMIPEEQDHLQATRGKCGDLVMQLTEFKHFITRIQPDVIACATDIVNEKLREYCGMEVPAYKGWL